MEMTARDGFSEYYGEFLEATYDVVDRIVVRAYYPLGGTGGGMRSWWRQLHGSDENLDDTHLMRMASRFSRRLRAWAKKQDIPVIYCNAGDAKHEIGEEHIPTTAGFRGVFLVLVNRARAPLWEVSRFRSGSLNIRRKNPMPWVNHYFFHILDDEWGHVTIRMCGHPPFQSLIILNGHEYTASQASRRHIDFAKDGNCFTEVPNAADLASVADTLSRSPEAIGRLRQVCERWIYSCLSFALPIDEQKRSGFYYRFSLFQAEYSRNLLFTSGRRMDQLFESVIDRIRGRLDLRTIKTIFGYKKRTHRRKGRAPRLQVVLEKPAYDMTVLKLHFGSLTLRMYTKGERVLRIESLTSNIGSLRSGRLLEKFPEIVSRLCGILQRFLDYAHCVDACTLGGELLDELPLASQIGKTRIGGVDLNKPRMRAVLQAVLSLSPSPDGFSSEDLATKVSQILDHPYSQRQAAYDLKKLRAKHLIRLAESRRRYDSTPYGQTTIAALAILLDKVIKPVLAGAGRPRIGRPPKNLHPIDEHYRKIHQHMRRLFDHLNLAA